PLSLLGRLFVEKLALDLHISCADLLCKQTGIELPRTVWGVTQLVNNKHGRFLGVSGSTCGTRDERKPPRPVVVGVCFAHLCTARLASRYSSVPFWLWPCSRWPAPRPPRLPLRTPVPTLRKFPLRCGYRPSFSRGSLLSLRSRCWLT